MERRVLVVCQRYWPENQKLIDICEGLVERGIKVDVLCGQPLFSSVQRSKIKEGKRNDGMINGVKVMRCFEAGMERDGSMETFVNYLSFRIFSVRALKRLSQEKYDRVFIFQVSPVTMCAAGIKLAKKQKLRSFLYAAELWPHVAIDELDVRSRLFEKFLEKLSAHYYLKVDKLIVNSPNTKDYFLNTLKVPENKVIYIPQNAEKLYERCDVDNDLLERFAGSLNIVYIGDIGKMQRFQTLVEAAKMIKKARIRNIRFIIIGTGRMTDEFKEAVSKEQVKEMFFFEGAKHETEIPKYLNLADVLFDTRRSNEAEDFYVPLKLASYMAVGKPLLLSMGGEAIDIVKEADCGYVSEPEDAEALFNDIMKLYKLSRNERRVLGVNAKEYQREHFSRDRSMDMLIRELFASGDDKQVIEQEKEDAVLEETEYNWIDDSFR